MSKSKGHIELLISKAAKSAKSDRELYVKGVTFGRWWSDVGEYGKAAHWLTKYLMIYDKDAKAHKLLGEMYEKLDKIDSALDCYKSSLRVKAEQPDLLLKIAEMHVNPGPTQNAARAQVWLDKAASFLPNNPQIYRLRMELLFAQDALPTKLEGTMIEELKKRPADPSLYVEYVTFLKNQERLPEAFAFTLKTDQNHKLAKCVENDLDWIQCIIDTCQDYAEKMSTNEVTAECIKSYSLLLISICRSVWIHFEKENYDKAMENLVLLDVKMLSVLSFDGASSETESSAWKAVVTESKGQLFWLCGLALIHFATKGDISWVEATKLAAACYSRSLSIPMAEVSDTWAAGSIIDAGGDRLKVMGGLRMSQCSHMLYNLAATSHSQSKEENDVNEREWLLDITNNFCTEEGQQKIFQYLFGDDYETDRSMVYTDKEFQQSTATLVTEEDLTKYDTSAVLDLDLQTWIWVGVQWRQNLGNSLDPFSWINTIFQDLALAHSSSVKYGNIWNLCQLDLEAFIVGCILYAEKGVVVWKNVTPISDKYCLGTGSLPLPICKNFVTQKQVEWWGAACQLHCKYSKEKLYNANQLKALLRRGIEAIRVSGNHGLQLALVTGLANHFSAKAYAIRKNGLSTSSNVWLAYQRRAAHYWTYAQPFLLDVIHKRTRHKTEPLDKLFPATLEDPSVEEATSMLSEVYMCNGNLLVQEADLKKALETYAKADTPHASFSEALIYKQLLDNLEKEEPPLIGSSSNRKDNLTRKYTTRLEVTLTRLEQMPDEELLRRTEDMLHEHLEKYPTFAKRTESKQLFPETISKLQQNNTILSEVDESILPGPSKQSTPKAEPADERAQLDASNVSKFAQSLSAITSHLTTMQINFNDRLNKVEETSSPNPRKEGDDKAMKDMLNALQNLSTKIDSIQEQVSKSQQGTPVAPDRNVTSSQDDKIQQPRGPLPGYDQYRQSPFVGSPMQNNSQFYNLQGYHGYGRPQSPHGPPTYIGTPTGIPPMYGQTRMADPRAAGSPAGTPPVPVRPQYSHPGYPMPMGIPSPVGTPPMHVRTLHSQPSHSLPMSVEAANALSARFQTGIFSGAMRPSSPLQVSEPPPGPGSRPTSQPTEQGGLGTSLQGRVGLAQGDSAFSSRPGMFSSNFGNRAPASVPVNMVPQQGGGMPRPNLQPPALEESYVPPAAGRDSEILRSLLASGVTNPPVREPGLQYPGYIQFPGDKNTGSEGFKFQTPEEMDKDNRKLEAEEQADDAETALNDTGPHFEPIVTLPEVEVVTGEEDETECFAERAKLFRYVEGEWKERGVGVMKLLKHKETGKNRLLMRRDQIHKICCNHLIARDQTLKAMEKSEKTWIWNAIDFSEGRSKETFAIRFKNSEIANTFRDKFVQAQTENASIASPAKTSSQSAVSEANESKETNLPATSTAAPTTTPTTTPSTSAVKLPLFGSISPKFTLSQASPAALKLAARIGGASPQKQDTSKDQVDGGSDEEDDPHNRTGDGPHFEPVIPLPKKVETKTGEESEEVLFQYRAKLYRYVDKQWKERGVGDIKILHNNENGKCRIVMRREQVLKLCANHNITSEMNLTAFNNSDKSWVWTAFDHSDPECPRLERLAVKFKLSDTAAEFEKCFNQAKEVCGKKDPKRQGVASGGESSTNASSRSVTQEGASGFKVTTKGPLLQKKALGAWTCPGCSISNTPEESMCPCCNTRNPSAPQTAQQQLPGSFMPNQPQSSTAARFGAVSTNASAGFNLSTQSNVKISFGAPSSQSTSNIFGNKSTDNSSSASQPANTFGFGAPKAPIFGGGPSTGMFGNASSNQAQPQAAAKTSIFGGNSLSTFGNASSNPPPPQAKPVVFAASGPLTILKSAGQWSCKTCYTDNEASDAVCACCQEPNPNATETAKVGAGGTSTTGIFGLGATSKQTYSFGFVGSQNKETDSSKPAFASGTQGSPAFGGQNQKQPLFGNTLAGGNVFGNVGLPKPTLPVTSSPQRPSFPSVGDEEYESEEDDSDEYTTTSDSATESDEGVDAQPYRSPLNRPAPDADQEDVICLGEVLPSVALQDRATALMLPKHFYNFVKPGENVDSSATETEDETQNKEEKAFVKKQPIASQKDTQSGFTFGSIAGGSSFGDLASTNAKESGFAFGNTKEGWVGMGKQKPLFANLRDEPEQDGDESYVNEENNDAHFEPVIKLPDKVETVTGEEDEMVMYSQRCKLFRYHKPTNEWKERGVGDLKILQHKTTNRLRIVMRRDQVLKVCANHCIQPGMKLEPMKTSDKAWTWSAMDFSEDGEPRHEIFTARFKTADIANTFKATFDVYRGMIADGNQMTADGTSSLRNKELSDKAEKMKNELRFFKDKFSEPSRIDLNRTLTDESRTPQRPIAKGNLTPLVAQHAQQTGSDDAANTNIFQTSHKPKSLFPDDREFVFEIKKSESNVEEKEGTRNRKLTESSGSYDPQSESSDIHFDPIVQLPEKIDLVTGEEDEQVVFANRAKLYGYHQETAQWKERGVGDIKILQHMTTCKVRVIMRREQVFKLCLNHLIQPGLKLQYKDSNVKKTLVWIARDFSDTEKPDGELMQFAVRFKTPEIGITFKETWEEGAAAEQSGAFIEPVAENINLSIVSVNAMSPGPVRAQSPVSPVKPTTSAFSFANIPNPLNTTKTSQGGPVEVGGFIFGQQDPSVTSTPSDQVFKFDTKKLSFAFGSQKSTSSPFLTPAARAPSTTRNDVGNDSVSSNLFTTAAESPWPETSTENTLTASTSGNFVFGGSQSFSTKVTSKDYKPSPLIRNTNESDAPNAFSVQGSSRFQFKPETSEETVSKSEESSPPDEDVVFVSELLPSDDLIKKAEDLQLPRSFYLFESSTANKDFNDDVFDAEEERILKYLEDRDSGKLKQAPAKERENSGDEVLQSKPFVEIAESQEVASTPQSESTTTNIFGSFSSGATFAGLAGSTTSFTALASGVKTAGFKTDPNFQFPGAGQVMFQNNDESNDSEDPTKFQCQTDFKPVLDELPALVEVKTGEEGEEILFKERCKLYRYDQDAKQWKERGVGEIKLLRNEIHKLHRVVMRRDQVFKVCTNHVVGENTNPEYHLGNQKSCSYFIMDYTDGTEPKPERIAIRFKNENLCKKYMEKIAEIKANPGFS